MPTAIPEEFTLARLRSLLEVLIQYSDRSVEFVRPVYERSSQYFESVVEGAEILGLLQLKTDRIIVAERLTRSLEPTVDSQFLGASLKDAVLQSILTPDGPVSKLMTLLLRRFEFVEGQYRWKPRAADLPRYIGLRNILLGLGVIEFYPKEGHYVLGFAFSGVAVDRFRGRHISPEELSALNAARLKIGTRAEEAVVEFERHRLNRYPELAAEVTHVAASDAAAGYDVLSFECPVDQNTVHMRRYIEVKAVSLNDWRFHWTRNEVSSAQRLGNQYYLYLLPVVSPGIPSLEKMRVIQDPIPEVFENDQEWTRLCETYEITLRER
jgi:hypothetical protein